MRLYLVHPELREALLDYLKARPETEVDNLFVSQKQTAFSANALSHKMLKLFRDAGFDGASSSLDATIIRYKLYSSGRRHRFAEDFDEPRQHSANE